MLTREDTLRIYSTARELHNESTRNTLRHSKCSRKWGETLKFTIFGVKSILALRGHGGGLLVALAEKASLLGSQFDSKQCCEQFIIPLCCFPHYRCNALVFWTTVFPHLLLELDTYGGVDPSGVFSLFLKMVADIIAKKLSIIFHRLIHLGSFLKCWQSANVTANPNGAPSHNKENYNPYQYHQNPIV